MIEIKLLNVPLFFLRRDEPENYFPNLTSSNQFKCFPDYFRYWWLLNFPLYSVRAPCIVFRMSLFTLFSASFPSPSQFIFPIVEEDPGKHNCPIIITYFHSWQLFLLLSICSKTSYTFYIWAVINYYGSIYLFWERWPQICYIAK